MYTIEPTITKEFILKRIQQEQIFSFYLHHNSIELRKTIYCNDLRGDRNPTCSYDIGSSGDLLMRDFALGRSYSWIQVVMEFYLCTYQEALINIAEDFKLINNGSSNKSSFNSNSYSISNNIIINNIPKRLVEIKIKSEEWNKKNFKYWKDYGFKKETMDIFKIKPISAFWVNDNLFYCNNAFSYYHEFDQVHRRTILNLGVDKKYKWTKNTNDTHIQGYNLLPKNGDLLVLSKSYKDIASLFEYNIPAVATNSEGVPFKLEKIEEFKERFKRVILNIDHDTPLALENSIKLSNLYEVPAIYLPETLNKTSKDISGCRKDIGVKETGKLIKQLFNL